MQRFLVLFLTVISLFLLLFFSVGETKKKARAEGGQINKKRQQTGNMSAVPDLTENSQIILGTIGSAMVIGIGPQESPIGVSSLKRLHYFLFTLIFSQCVYKVH